MVKEQPDLLPVTACQWLDISRWSPITSMEGPSMLEQIPVLIAEAQPGRFTEVYGKYLLALR